MPTSSFEKRPNKVIYDTLNGHRPFNMYKMVIDFGYNYGMISCFRHAFNI